MFCWNFCLSMSMHSQYKVKCHKSQAQDPDWNFKSNIFTIFEVLYNLKLKTLTNDHWRKFKDSSVINISSTRNAKGAPPSSPAAPGVWPGPAGPARAPGGQGQQEVCHTAALAPEEQLPRLVTRLQAESGARPGDLGPVQGELSQRVSPWCPASGQKKHCGPARFVKTFRQTLYGVVKIISLSGGFTKSGNPVLIFPDKAGFPSVSEGDLLILLKYFISVVPRAEQVQ